MPATFDPKRYQPAPSQVESYATGQTPPAAPLYDVPEPPRSQPVRMNAGPVSQPPLSLQAIEARKRNFITGQGAQAAGAELQDVKAQPAYKTVADGLDSLRKRYGSDRAGLFSDAVYQDLTRQMADILKPVDLARGNAKTAAAQTFGAQDTGFNQAQLAQGAVPLTLDAMTAANDQTRANTGLIDAKMKNVGADTGMVQAQTQEIPANAASTRGLQGSEAGLNQAKAENLPRETEAKVQGNAELEKAQNQTLSLRQTLDQQNKDMASLRSQITELRALLKERGVDLVDRGQNYAEAEDKTDKTTSTTQPSGGSFNGSKSPLASNAGGGKAASGSFTVNPDGSRTMNGTQARYQKGADGNWHLVK